MAIEKAPLSLIDESGNANIGIFDEPITNLNYLDFVRPGGKKVSASRIKRWEYIGLASDKIILGGAVVSLHYLANVFFYVYERDNGKLTEFNFMAPLCRGVDFSSNGATGKISFEKGKQHVIIENDRASGKHNFDVSLNGLKVKAELEDNKHPMVCVSRVGFSGYNYTLKVAGMPTEASIEINSRKLKLTRDEAFGVIDYTTGCLARETFWNWASGGGTDTKGNVLGINLVLGVNESGVTENAFWIGDKMVKVDTVRFDYNRQNILDPWHIHSWDGRVDLTFAPEGQRFENLNLGVMASKFHQPFGKFEGVLTDEAGKKHTLKDFYGYTEEHFARW
jgi:Domain of unknown function (DUF2804), C-terminal/Domain of unknown function (DUF2804), N-terminal